ncbi:MAG: ABC transporter permease [Rhodospirillaceae bacterium]|nr:ABC transporter permease [Rhodospirillaceae bacterium]
MRELIFRYGAAATAIMVFTTVAWVLGLLILPQLTMIDYSFRLALPLDQVGGPNDAYTLTNYAFLFGNAGFLSIFIKTIWSSILVTLVAFVMCYPLAYYLARGARLDRARLLIVALIVPYWINEILRTFAWMLILARGGLINTLLLDAGVIDQPIVFLGATPTILLGMVYAYVLFMVFPIYNVLDTLDHGQIEAARDLGAPWWRIHWRIALPHAKPGIAVGCISTFMLAAGSYAVPTILGGPQSRWFTEVIYSQFFEGMNWNRGAAFAFLLLLVCIGFIMVMMRLFRVSLGEVAR